MRRFAPYRPKSIPRKGSCCSSESAAPPRGIIRPIQGRSPRISPHLRIGVQGDERANAVVYAGLVLPGLLGQAQRVAGKRHRAGNRMP